LKMQLTSGWRTSATHFWFEGLRDLSFSSHTSGRG
jgi:hypothetical protein